MGDVEKEDSKYRVAWDMTITLSRFEDEQKKENFGTREYYLDLYSECLKRMIETEKSTE